MKHQPTSRRRRTTKSVLRLLDLEHAKTAVLNTLTSPDAQRGYRHAIDEFVDWYCSEPRLAFNRIVVLRYRSHLESRQLAPGTINLRLGAVRRLAYEAADCGLLSADLAAGMSESGEESGQTTMWVFRRAGCGPVLTSSCVSAEDHAELSRETALTSASLQMKNEFASVAQYAVGQVSIMR